MIRFLGFLLFVLGCGISTILAETPPVAPTIQVIDKVGTFVIKYADKVVMICEAKAANCKRINDEGVNVSSSGTLIYPSTVWGTTTPSITYLPGTPNSIPLEGKDNGVNK